MAYTPGVARVSSAIHDDPAKAWTLTIKGNAVAVVTDGTAVLGLGDIGPAAAMPVMEGKAMLFKQFAGVDAFPLCLDTKDADEIVAFVKAVAPGFGGINLEDIAAPRCFEIERRLRAELDIPVFHDDQHGTAIVVLAALVNALRVVGKNAGEIKVVVVGAGAAGVACAEIILAHGVQNMVVCDLEGALYAGRPGLDPERAALAARTNPPASAAWPTTCCAAPTCSLGVSGPGAVSAAAVRTMAPDPIVFAMANPVPEIQPEEVRDDVAIMATGRSDYPNQINNVLAFPGVFRGALDIRASTINEEMKLAAARAIAAVITDDELHADYVIPSVFNRGVAEAVAAAVAEAGTRSGVARRPAAASVAGALIRQDGRVPGSSGATVTVIFADVEGSTALLERLGQARWLTWLAEYEEMLAQSIARHGGTLVKALGDGHLLAFPSANAALRCAVEVQRALPLDAAPDLRVRMGLHTGEPVALEDDLHGRTVVKAARIADLAHGGEVLVSGIVRELAETDADLEEEIWFEESREVELRGLRGRHLVLAAQWQREDRGPIRVVIADDSAIVRDGVAAVLRECGVHVAGLATDPESALSRDRAPPPRRRAGRHPHAADRAPTRAWSPPSTSVARTPRSACSSSPSIWSSPTPCASSRARRRGAAI